MRNVTSLLVSGVVLSSSVVLSCRQALSFEPGTMGGDGDARGAPVEPPAPMAGSWTTPAAASCGEVLVGGVGEAEVAFTAPPGSAVDGIIEGAGSTVTLAALQCTPREDHQECVARLRCTPTARGETGAELVLSDGRSRRRLRTSVVGYDVARIELTGDGQGLVAADTGQRCSGPCELRFTGAALTLTAETVGDATFTGFAGACSSKTECVIRDSGALTARAEFRLPKLTELPLLERDGGIGSLELVDGKPTACVWNDRHVKVRQYAPDGTTVWTTDIPSQGLFEPFVCVLGASTSGSLWAFVRLHIPNEFGIKLAAHKISGDGSIVASHVAEDEPYYYAFDVAVSADGAVASGYTPIGTKLHPYFRKVVDSGQLAWQTTLEDIEGYVPAVAVARDGSIYGAAIQERAPILSNAVLVKVAPDGNVAWRRTLDSGRDLRDSYHAIATTADGIVVAGQTGADLLNEQGGRGVVRKYSPEGSLIWEYVFGDRSEINRPTSLTSAADGSSFLISEHRDGLQLRKLDPAGHEVWRRPPLPSADRDSPIRGAAVDAQGNLLVLARPKDGPHTAHLWTFFQ